MFFLKKNVECLSLSFFLSRMTFVITHGYMEHGKKNWLQEMMSELLRNGDHNVIIVVSRREKHLYLFPPPFPSPHICEKKKVCDFHTGGGWGGVEGGGVIARDN